MSTSFFNNISVSGSAVCDSVTCNSLNTSAFNINTTDWGISGTLDVNTITPYSGSNMTIQVPNLLNLNSNIANINSPNININGNLNILNNLSVLGNASLSNLTLTNSIIAPNLSISGNANISGFINGNVINTNFLSTPRLINNVTSGNAITFTGNAFIASTQTSSSYTIGNSVLAVSNNTRFDNAVTGSIFGNVYPQLSWGSGREWCIATEVTQNSISYIGCSDGIGADSDYFITMRSAVGLKIDPLCGNTNFSDALYVVGDANISSDLIVAANITSGNLRVSGDANIVGNLTLPNPVSLQTYAFKYYVDPTSPTSWTNSTNVPFRLIDSTMQYTGGTPSTNNSFIVPFSGLWYFTTQLNINQAGGGSTLYRAMIHKSTLVTAPTKAYTSYTTADANVFCVFDGNDLPVATRRAISMNTIIKCTSGDYIRVYCSGNGTGAMASGITTPATVATNFLSGYLITKF
jgi:hypothetical protein